MSRVFMNEEYEHYNSDTIPTWKVNNGIFIFPHLVMRGSKTREELLDIANDIKNKFSDVSIYIDENNKNNYCYELNNTSFIILSFNIKSYKYMYMVRYDKYYDETYFCSFFNIKRDNELGFRYQDRKFYRNSKGEMVKDPMSNVKFAEETIIKNKLCLECEDYIKSKFPSVKNTNSFPVYSLL